MLLWQPAYIGVGSNLGEPGEQLSQAFTKLAQLPRTRVLLTSPIYRSRPFGPVKQTD